MKRGGLVSEGCLKALPKNSFVMMIIAFFVLIGHVKAQKVRHTQELRPLCAVLLEG